MHIEIELRWLPMQISLEGAVGGNDLPLNNDLEAWLDSSVREFESRRESVIFSHVHFSFLPKPVTFTNNIEYYRAIKSFNFYKIVKIKYCCPILTSV